MVLQQQIASFVESFQSPSHVDAVTSIIGSGQKELRKHRKKFLTSRKMFEIICTILAAVIGIGGLVFMIATIDQINWYGCWDDEEF